MNTLTKNDLRNLRLESIYHSLETSFGIVRAKIFSGDRPTKGDLDCVVDFIAAQIVRTPKFRSSRKISIDGDQEAKLAEIGDLQTRLAAEKSFANVWANRFPTLCLMAYPKVLECLQQMRVHVYKAAEPCTFITSDAPCCVIEYADSALSLMECLSSPTVNILMPLSPEVVAILHHSDEPHEMTQIFPGHPSVDKINSMIWNGAVDEIVLPSKTVRAEWFSSIYLDQRARYVAL
jgi:Protein of unknown function (DUF4238)